MSTFFHFTWRAQDRTSSREKGGFLWDCSWSGAAVNFIREKGFAYARLEISLENIFWPSFSLHPIVTPQSACVHLNGYSTYAMFVMSFAFGGAFGANQEQKFLSTSVSKTESRRNKQWMFCENSITKSFLDVRRLKIVEKCACSINWINLHISQAIKYDYTHTPLNHRLARVPVGEQAFDVDAQLQCVRSSETIGCIT